MDWKIAFAYTGTAWFVQLCMLSELYFVAGKKSEYLLFMSIRGEQRKDEDVLQVVRDYKKEFWGMMAALFVAAGGFFPISLLPAGTGSISLFYLILWTTVLIILDYRVVKKYANRMYEQKLSKGWGNPPRASAMEIDTMVSRLKKSMPVSEIWLAVPAWICIGSFVWWFYAAPGYKLLLVSLVLNVAAFFFFCYMYHRMSHGRLKVYSEDSELNYALNRVSRRAWTGCIVWEASILCGVQFIVTVLLHSYMEEVAAGAEDMTGFWILFIGSMAGSVLLMLALFFSAANRVRRVKKELAAAADFSYVEDEDAYWKNGYYYNPNDTNTFVENRSGYGITTNMATKWGAITKWILISVLLLCIGIGVALLPLDFGKMTMQADADRITLKACVYYKETLAFHDVSEVYLLTERPRSSRIWGTGTERFCLGEYRFNEYGNGKAMLDKEAEYFIMVKRQNGKWLGFSTTDNDEMLAVYERLREQTGQ